MKKQHLSKILLFALLFLASQASAQFTFECVCTYVTPPNCDLCTPQVQSRLFKGLLIRRNGVAHKWIDAPYIVREQGNSLAIQEIVFPNPESITLTLQATPYATMTDFKAAINCSCGGASYIAGPGIIISGDTLKAVDIAANNEGILGVGAGGANTAIITSNTTGANGVTVSGGTGISITETTSTNGGTITVTNTGVTGVNGGTGAVTINGERGITVGTAGSTVTVGMPTATTSQTLRYDGTNWASNSEILNNGNEIGVGGSPISGFEAYINGATRTDGTGVFRGTGDPVSTTAASSVRLWNTGGSAQIWRLSSLDDGRFAINSDNSGDVFRGTTAGDCQTVARLQVSSVTGVTPTALIGRDGTGFVGNVALGAGLSLSGGTLSVTGGSGTVTSVAATAPAAGFTITGSPITTSGTLTFALNADLAGLEGLSTTGIAVRTGTSTWATRTLVAGTNISLTNANGVAGDITINSTAGTIGPLVASRVTLSAGTNSVTDDGEFTYDSTANRASIAGATTTAVLNLGSATTTGALDGCVFQVNTTGGAANVVANTNNTSNTADAGMNLTTGGSSAGDPYVRYAITGIATQFAEGMDNSATGDPFRITAGASRPGGAVNSGMTILPGEATFHGFNQDVPTQVVDVNGRAKANQFIGTSVYSTSNIALSTGAGTSPTVNSCVGSNNGFHVTFTTGTAPVNNGLIMTVSYPLAFVNGVIPSAPAARNLQTAADINKIYADAATTGTLTIRANGTLLASTQYSFSMVLMGY